MEGANMVTVGKRFDVGRLHEGNRVPPDVLEYLMWKSRAQEMSPRLRDQIRGVLVPANHIEEFPVVKVLLARSRGQQIHRPDGFREGRPCCREHGAERGKTLLRSGNPAIGRGVCGNPAAALWEKERSCRTAEG